MYVDSEGSSMHCRKISRHISSCRSTERLCVTSEKSSARSIAEGDDGRQQEATTIHLRFLENRKIYDDVDVMISPHGLETVD